MKNLNQNDLKSFLDEKYKQYNNPKFISSDPIQIPHSFSTKEDIEISGFLTSVISWGKRKVIINNANQMMGFFDNSPHDFILNHSEKDLESIHSFVHRTFNSLDLIYFIRSLKHIYNEHNGLEPIFTDNCLNNSTQNSIHVFKKIFLNTLMKNV